MGLIPRLAYCNIWIFHVLSKRDTLTHELEDLDTSQSQADMGAFFTDEKQAWEASEQHAQLCSILSTQSLHHVTKIVAFACGSMSWSDQSSGASRAAYQHALVITLRAVIGGRQSNPDEIQCFAQDPRYTDLDRAVLEKNGISIVDDPQGFLEVDETSVVCSFSADAPIREIVADIARPAMMVWDHVDISGEEVTHACGSGCSKCSTKPCKTGSNTSRPDCDSPRLTKMCQEHYEEIMFPPGLDAFKCTNIYVRLNVFP